MKKTNYWLSSAVLGLAIIAGCNSEPNDKKSGTDKKDSGEHVHADGTVLGSHSEEGHAHAEGPHGGTIADWGGGKFHVEFTVDHDKQQATAYILGNDEKTATPIDSEEVTLAIKDPELTVALKPIPQEGDTEGMASRFVGNHEGLGVVKKYEGSMSAVVGGTPYSGNFKEEAHDH